MWRERCAGRSNSTRRAVLRALRLRVKLPARPNCPRHMNRREQSSALGEKQRVAHYGFNNRRARSIDASSSARSSTRPPIITAEIRVLFRMSSKGSASSSTRSARCPAATLPNCASPPRKRAGTTRRRRERLQRREPRGDQHLQLAVEGPAIAHQAPRPVGSRHDLAAGVDDRLTIRFRTAMYLARVARRRRVLPVRARARS